MKPLEAAVGATKMQAPTEVTASAFDTMYGSNHPRTQGLFRFCGHAKGGGRGKERGKVAASEGGR